MTTFIFSKIPSESSFTLFDFTDNKKIKHFKISPDKNEKKIFFEIPHHWQDPRITLRSSNYMTAYEQYSIDREKESIYITGKDFYINSTRSTNIDEENKDSIKGIIETVNSNTHLNDKQKFYMTVISLQSYFEYLVYGMLVLSGQMSKGKFEDLTSESTIEKAFSLSNSNFLQDDIKISNIGRSISLIIDENTRITNQNSFELVRKIRNKLVHSWAFKDYPKDTIIEKFSQLNMEFEKKDNLNFYKEATIKLQELYCKSNKINTKVEYLYEKYAISKERIQRGYQD